MESDRRLFARFKASFPTRFQDSAEGNTEKVLLKDVSAEGLKLSSSKRVNLNDKISLVVCLPDGHVPMVLKGEVIWTQMTDLQQCDVGLRFDQINLMKTQRIYKLRQN